MIKFYDTCSLLDLQNKLFEDDEKFIISLISLIELEEIKTASYKDEDIKYSARQLIHLLINNKDKFDVYNPSLNTIDNQITNGGLPLNNDNRIIFSALSYQENTKEDLLFITSDAACYTIASHVGLQASFLLEDDDKYGGFKIIEMNDDELSHFYSDILINNTNDFELLLNKYFLIKYENKIIDKYKWCENKYIKIPFYKTESKMFGTIVPKDNDPYQQIALDSLYTNQITMLRGPAGTGKSYLAFGYMFDLLEKGTIDKIIVFCNTVATKGSAKLGFYPGSRTEKLLDSQIGNLLVSKIGDRIAVERLIDDGQLILLPMSDIRGYDTTGMKAAIYISEAQNLDIELIRLALQRVGEDSICILDGDSETQVDLGMYSGSRNGMKRTSKVFRDHDFYGEVTLQNIYRSKIANLAQEL